MVLMIIELSGILSENIIQFRDCLIDSEDYNLSILYSKTIKGDCQNT